MWSTNPMTNTLKKRKWGRHPIIWEYHLCSYRQAAVAENNGCATLAVLHVAGVKVHTRTTKPFHDFSPSSTTGIYSHGKCEATSVCPRDSMRLESQKAKVLDHTWTFSATSCYGLLWELLVCNSILTGNIILSHVSKGKHILFYTHQSAGHTSECKQVFCT